MYAHELSNSRIQKPMELEKIIHAAIEKAVKSNLNRVEIKINCNARSLLRLEVQFSKLGFGVDSSKAESLVEHVLIIEW